MLANKVAVASAFGYLSIGCWLCAQLPQVIKNASLKSCEGLALPFLVTWLFGDFTNLVGCLLTDQLPFQTYLATYFCFIDITLLWQYFHYAKPKPPSSVKSYTPSHSMHNSLVFTGHPASPRARLASSPHLQPLSSSHSQRPRIRRQPTAHGYASNPDTPGLPYTDASYAAIYEAALDVARAAERASAHRSASRRRQSRRATGTSNGTATVPGTGDVTDDDAMIDSIHSDLSRQSSTHFDADDSHMTASTGFLDGRGRSRKRKYTPADTPLEEYMDQAGPLAHSVLGLMAPPEDERRRRDTSRSLSLARGASGRGGRRAAGVALMSLGLFARFYGGSFVDTTPTATSTGVVLSNPTPPPAYPSLHPPIHAFRPLLEDSISSSGTLVSINNGTEHHHDDDYPPREPSPDFPWSFQRLVGRVSAWTCTTLYLSSRLPQIWKNFQRKSVEGLSILLFFFAFCGNTTYVISILLNPAGNSDPSEAIHYLLESLPYLIGSGGTLVFDLTILFQGWLYGSDLPVDPIAHSPISRPRRGRIASHRKKNRHVEDGGHSTTVNERAPLLTKQRSTSSLSPSMSRQRDRALSPDLRFTPASAVKTGDNGDQAGH